MAQVERNLVFLSKIYSGNLHLVLWERVQICHFYRTKLYVPPDVAAACLYAVHGMNCLFIVTQVRLPFVQ